MYISFTVLYNEYIDVNVRIERTSVRRGEILLRVRLTDDNVARFVTIQKLQRLEIETFVLEFEVKRGR